MRDSEPIKWTHYWCPRRKRWVRITRAFKGDLKHSDKKGVIVVTETNE